MDRRGFEIGREKQSQVSINQILIFPSPVEAKRPRYTIRPSNFVQPQHDGPVRLPRTCYARHRARACRKRVTTPVGFANQISGAF